MWNFCPMAVGGLGCPCHPRLRFFGYLLSPEGAPFCCIMPLPGLFRGEQRGQQTAMAVSGVCRSPGAKAWPLKGRCVHQGRAQGRDGRRSGMGSGPGRFQGLGRRRAGKGAWRGRVQGWERSMAGTGTGLGRKHGGDGRRAGTEAWRGQAQGWDGHKAGMGAGPGWAQDWEGSVLGTGAGQGWKHGGDRQAELSQGQSLHFIRVFIRVKYDFTCSQSEVILFDSGAF